MLQLCPGYASLSGGALCGSAWPTYGHFRQQRSWHWPYSEQMCLICRRTESACVPTSSSPPLFSTNFVPLFGVGWVGGGIVHLLHLSSPSRLLSSSLPSSPHLLHLSCLYDRIHVVFVKVFLSLLFLPLFFTNFWLTPSCT